MSFKNVTTRTKDGLLIDVDFSFQYRIKTSLVDLLILFYKFPYVNSTILFHLFLILQEAITSINHSLTFSIFISILFVIFFIRTPKNLIAMILFAKIH